MPRSRGRFALTADAPGAEDVTWSAQTIGLPTSQKPPFVVRVDSRALRDGPLTIRATADGAAGQTSDYVVVVVDNTPPTGALAPETLARVGRRLMLQPGASDANGIATVRVRWGDGSRQTLRGGRATRALRHRFRRPGAFRVLVTITDRAGNVRRARTLVRAS